MSKIRSGREYVASLLDDRGVYINGKRVEDVSTHTAFANTVKSFASLYDFQSRPENQDLMTFETGAGRRVNRAWQLPKTREDLVGRRKAMEAWAGEHLGLLGRSPDHVASTLVGMYIGIDAFVAHGPARAAAVKDYYHYARDNDLFISYVIQNPQADKTKSASEQLNPHLVASIVDEDSVGITVRGAKMLGTSAVMSNEIFVASVQPLRPGEEAYAISFAVPVGTAGLKLLSRKSYEEHSGDAFDYPLSSHFDENDAVAYFDDVKVPWDRVFVYRDTKMSATLWHGTPTHVIQNYQSQVRLMVKMRFYAGLGRRIAETIGTIDMPPVKAKLGELSAYASMVESFVSAMEADGSRYGDYYVPSAKLLYAAQVMTQSMYPKMIDLMRDLSGGGVIMLPSSIKDLEDTDLRKIIRMTQISPVRTPEERVKLMRLAWDAIGSEFASRHVQYEMFYAGASHITTANAYRTFNWSDALSMVDGIEQRISFPPTCG